MKTIAIALLLATGVAASAARADHVDVRGSINFGAPVYATPAPMYAPGYYAPERGYWRDVSENVLVPGHWATRYNAWGSGVNYWVPTHYELRTRRVWVDGDHERREREEHERWEHERSEHDRRDWHR